MLVGKTVPILLKVVLMIHGVLRCSVASNWPDGTYGLPRSVCGCPSGWEEGYRYHDTENFAPSNHWSNPLHLRFGWDRSRIRNPFCMKTVADFAGQFGPAWPRGKYCIYRRGGSCPSGFVTDQDTFIYWDDENDYNANRFGGVLPDGTYDRNTRIQFCCRSDGSTWRGMSLPTNSCFFLFALSGRFSRCQEVIGMTVTPEWLYWDNEDDSNTDSQSSVHPYGGIESSGVNITFCFYT